MDSNLINTNTEKHKRRSKVDKINRNYICGCGKTYLSYPALYTHIKTKHNGDYPEGTVAHIMSSSKKRGRPKKMQEEDKEIDRILMELDMIGGSTDAKSELVDSPLYSFIDKWENLEFDEGEVQIDDAFAIYLLYVSKIVDPQNFSQIVKFIETFRKSLEKKENAEVKSIPSHLESFVQHYIPLYIPSFDRGLAAKLGVHFALWLYSKKLTDLKVIPI